MASNDFMIGLRINTAAAQKDVASFYSFLESQQARAAGKGAQVAQLPKNAVSGAFGDATDPTGLRKSTALQKQFIADKAKLLGLLERQAALTVQAGGGKLDKQGLPVAAGARAAVTGLRGGVEASIARSLGLEELTPVLKGQLTKALNGVRTDLSTALSGLSGVDLQREFSRQASTILGTTNVDAFKATTVSAERAAAQSQNILANLIEEGKATKASANASKDSAVATQLKAKAAKEASVISSKLSTAQARALAILQRTGGELSATDLGRLGIKTQTVDALSKKKLIGKYSSGHETGVSVTELGGQVNNLRSSAIGLSEADEALINELQKQVGLAKQDTVLAERGHQAKVVAEQKDTVLRAKLSDAQARALAVLQQSGGQLSATQLSGAGVKAQTLASLQKKGLIEQSATGISITDLGTGVDTSGAQLTKANQEAVAAAQAAAALQGRYATLTKEQVDAMNTSIGLTDRSNVALVASTEALAAKALADKKAEANSVKLNALQERALALIQTAGITDTGQLKSLGVSSGTLKALSNRGLVQQTEGIVAPTELGAARDVPSIGTDEINRLRGLQLSNLERITAASGREAAAAEQGASSLALNEQAQRRYNELQTQNEARSTEASSREAALRERAYGGGRGLPPGAGVGGPKELPGSGGRGGGGGAPPPGGGGFFDDDFERRYGNFVSVNDAASFALQQLQATGTRLALLNEFLGPLGDITGTLYSEYLENRARMELFNREVAASTLELIATNEGSALGYGRSKAREETYRTDLAAAREQAFVNDPALASRYTSSKAEETVRKAAREADVKETIATTELAQQQLETARILESVQAQFLQLIAASGGNVQAAAGLRTAQLGYRNSILEAQLQDAGFIAEAQRARALGDRRKTLSTGGRQPGFGGFVQSLGYDKVGGASPREFFGGGALASLRYGLPSLLLYSGLSGIANTTKEAEELNYALSVLEGQFEATFEGQDFGPVRQQIIDVAKDTGLAADELALLRVQLTGAFGQEGLEIDGLTGTDLIEEQTEAAAKLAQTVKLPLGEITDGLTAASLAFDESFERIGDVAVRLEEKSGVLAKETVSFIGDIAPVAEEAGYSLEEFSAIAAVAQQRSGRSGAALAEAFGRVVPEITKQKEALLDLASTEDALANAGFIDAIRASDPRRILEQIGSAYGQVSTEGQQQITQILGGRREAQVIIPVITNQDAVDEFTREAENSAGALDRRYEKVRETLTNTFQRLSEQVREIVITLLDSGITDTLETVAGILGKIAGILTPILGIVGDVNSALAGWPIHILAAFAAYKTFAAFRAADDTRRGAFANGVAGIPGRIGGNFNAGFQSSLISQFGPAGQGGLARFAQAGAGSKFRAGGAGLLSVLGGGSVATGGLVVAAVAATAAYSAVKGQIDQVNEDVNSTVEEITKINQEKDVYNPETSQDVRDRQATNLREQAANLRTSYENSAGFWERVNVDLIGAQSEADAVLAEAARLEAFDPETFKFYDSIDLGIERDITEQFLPKLGEPLSDFRNALEEDITAEYGTIGDKVRDHLGKIFSPGSAFDEIAYDPGFSEAEQEYIDEVAKLAGVAGDDLDKRIVKLIADNSDNAVAIIGDVLGGTLSAADLGLSGSFDAESINQLQAIYDNLRTKAEGDPELQKSIDALTGLELTPFEETALKYEQFNEAYEAGILSFNDYVSAIAENAASRQENLNLDTDTPAGLDEILDNIKKQRDDAQKISDAILGRQEVLTKIAEELGASEDQLQFKQAVDATRNLDDPNFTDPEARLDAALQLQKARAETELRVAQEAGDLERVNQILNEGVDIDADIRGVLYSAQLIAGDDTFNEFASAYRLISSELISGLEDLVQEDLSKVYGDEFAARTKAAEGESNANLRNRPKDEIQSKIKGMVSKLVSKQVSSIREVLDQPVELILEQALTDIFEDGALEPGNLNALNAILGVVGKSIADGEGLTDTQINALYGTLDGIVQLLHFAGVSRDQILAAVTPDSANFFQRTAIQLQTSAAIAGSNLSADELKTSQLNQEADSITESFVELDKVRADANQTLVNQIEIEAAGNELVVARTRGNIEEINAAEARLGKALQAGRDHQSDFRQAYLGLQQAYAEVAGNNIQAAILESAGIQEQLSNATASGSDNTAGIQAQLVRANESIRQALIADQTSNYELMAAVAEARGNTIGAAQVGIAQAQFVLRNARGTQNINNAKIALEQANQRLRDELIRHRAEQFDLLTAIVAGDDPLAQAQIAQAEAREALQRAIGPSEIAQARIQVIEADRAVAKAMQDIRSSLFDLRQAQLDAVGDEVGSAQVAAQQARQQLQDAIANKAGAAQINSLRAQVISADKAAKDAVFNERRDEYDFLYEMGRITKSQYINYLEGLKSTLIPGTAQFRDLELAIKRLKDDVSGDLQANLPTSLALPTLYEVRRLNQTPGTANAPAGTSIGYQDNRQVDVQITIGQNMSEGEIVDVLGKALGVGTSGSSPRRY